MPPERDGRGSSTMPAGLWRLVTGPEMRALEERTMATRGISGERLMESAGKALLDPVLALRESSARSQANIRILCGSGNNGGDGFVLARHLFNRGVASETILLGEVASLPKAAAAHWAEPACPALHTIATYLYVHLYAMKRKPMQPVRP